MDNTALILITVTNVILVLVLGLMAFLVYKLVKGQGKSSETPAPPQTAPADDPKYHPEILDRMTEMKKVKPQKRTDLFCPNHPDEPGEASCAICDKLFCKTCVRPFKALHFCREHIGLVMNHEWEEILTLKTSTHNPEDGVHLYDEKKRLFEELNLPTYIETHYKINVDSDYIETYLVLFSIRENVEAVKANLN